MSWPELADHLNKELRDDITFLHESAYRKPYQSALLYYNNVFSKVVSDDEYAKALQVQKDELYKAKKQFFDQRREYNKLLDADARWEHLTDRLTDSAKEAALCKPLTICKTNFKTGKKEAVLCFSDWHYGLVADNIFNKYNPEICRQRVATLVEKAIRYVELHGIRTIHILLLGDAAHAAIHTGTRVSSNEDTCDQLMHVSELLAESINHIADRVDWVKVYSTYGNHLRTIQNKHDSIHSDNMEKIIPWWLKQRLSYRDDVEIIESEYYEFIRLNVLNHSLCATHGDLDTIKNLGMTVNTLFTQVYGDAIQYAVMADKHHLEEFESFGIESILCPSLCGSEEYSSTHRLYAKPAQTLMIFSESEGRECTYNIRV